MLISSAFKPPVFLRNRHLQTTYAPLFRKQATPLRIRESFWLADGDFLELDWVYPDTLDYRGVVILLHGLTGSSDSQYLVGLQNRLKREAYLSVVMHFRGCGGKPNLQARTYHAGETGDFQQCYRFIRHKFPNLAIHVAGFSLGGNVLLKWLGENPHMPEPPASAMAVSVPLLLDVCADQLNRGLSRIYRNRLLGELKAYQQHKKRFFAETGRHEELARLESLGNLDALRTFRDYDQHVIAPLHGFASAEDYYRQSSSRQFLKHIAINTLVLQARDDPFMTPAVIPAEHELGPTVTFELSRHGGHVGFVTHPGDHANGYYVEHRLMDWLGQQEGKTP